ncbi:MAG: zf-HC2 domain-containing protein [Bacteroidota bacterium]
MHCHKIKNKLFFLAEGSLNEDEKLLIYNHLDQCPSCLKQYELLSGFENILQEEKNLSADEFFYSKLISRMERISSLPEKLNYQPAWIRLANIIIITLIIGVAAFSGITLAERNYRYFGTSQENQQVSGQQSDIAVGQDPYINNFSEY